MKLIPLDQFSGHFLWEAFPGPTGTVKGYLLFEGERMVLDIEFFFNIEGLTHGKYLINVCGGYEVTSPHLASFPYS